VVFRGDRKRHHCRLFHLTHCAAVPVPGVAGLEAHPPSRRPRQPQPVWPPPFTTLIIIADTTIITITPKKPEGETAATWSAWLDPPGVNFINVLSVPFAPIFLRQKNLQCQNVTWENLRKALSYAKFTLKMLWNRLQVRNQSIFFPSVPLNKFHKVLLLVPSSYINYLNLAVVKIYHS